MQEYTKLLSALYNGISEQAPNLRLPSQVDSQDNFIADVAGGLYRKPGSSLVTNDFTGPGGAPIFIPVIGTFSLTTSGVTNDFVAIAYPSRTSGRLEIGKVTYGTHGISIAKCYTSSGAMDTYLATAQPGISYLPVGQSVLVLNPAVTTALSGTRSVSSRNCLVFVKRGLSGTEYSVTLVDRHGKPHIAKYKTPEASNGTAAASHAGDNDGSGHRTGYVTITSTAARDYFVGQKVTISGSSIAQLGTTAAPVTHRIESIDTSVKPNNVFTIRYDQAGAVYVGAETTLKISDELPAGLSNQVAAVLGEALTPATTSGTYTVAGTTVSFTAAAGRRGFVTGSTVYIDGTGDVAMDGLYHTITSTGPGVAPNTFTITAAATGASGSATTITTGLRSAEWSVTVTGNVINIVSIAVSGTHHPFNAATTYDSYGNQAISVINGVTAKYTDLPYDCVTDGSVVKISGTNEDQFAAYYMKFNASETRWEETLEPVHATTTKADTIDATKMPQLLTYAAGVFTASTPAWDNRVTGDDESNPQPSFINNTITSMFFHKNRLGFISGENVILSRAADYYNFWFETATDILDTDPIDVASGEAAGVFFNGVLQVNGELLLVASNGFYIMRCDENIWTPTSASIDRLVTCAVNTAVAPIVMDDRVIYLATAGAYQNCWELKLADDGRSYRPRQLNAHCPTQLGSVCAMAGFPNAGIVLFEDLAEERFTVYKEYTDQESGSHVQNMWAQCTWAGPVEFGTMLPVRDAVLVFRTSATLAVVVLEQRIAPNIRVPSGLVKKNVPMDLWQTGSPSATFTLPNLSHTLTYSAFVYSTTDTALPPLSLECTVVGASATIPDGAALVSAGYNVAIIGVPVEAQITLSRQLLAISRDGTGAYTSSMLQNATIAYRGNLRCTLTLDDFVEKTTRVQELEHDLLGVSQGANNKQRICWATLDGFCMNTELTIATNSLEDFSIDAIQLQIGMMGGYSNDIFV